MCYQRCCLVSSFFRGPQSHCWLDKVQGYLAVRRWASFSLVNSYSLELHFASALAAAALYAMMRFSNPSFTLLISLQGRRYDVDAIDYVVHKTGARVRPREDVANLVAHSPNTLSFLLALSFYGGGDRIFAGTRLCSGSLQGHGWLSGFKHKTCRPAKMCMRDIQQKRRSFYLDHAVVSVHHGLKPNIRRMFLFVNLCQLILSYFQFLFSGRLC